jgi:serine/threonine protein kinase/tetratricopeptide (TPR) repeat protein
MSDLESSGPEQPEPVPGSGQNGNIGRQIGNYKLLELIGEGGMGEVYRAEQTRPFRRQVAIKIIKLGMSTAEFTERFESERQALALMDHPHIAKVYDAGATERGRPYFVMEYVPGVPISKYCDENKLDIRARLELFIRVCEGLQHAHQKGIIHRDIKPSNVLVTSENDEVWPKIIDFGVAKTLDQKLTEHTIQTAMGQIMGTPEYMSPEQADLAEQHIDTRTDIYLLGELLYILLAGVPPFDPEQLKGQGLQAMLYQIRAIDPPRPSLRLAELDGQLPEIAASRAATPQKLVSTLQGDLDWITMRALEKEQDRRYQTSQELIQEIGRYLKDEPVLAGPPSTSYRVHKFVKRNRIGVLAASLVLAALVLGTIGTTVGLVRSKRAEALARTEAETSRQISEFMVGLFEVSDPSEALGNTITARQILDQGVEKIETGLADQPETRARLMNTMGRVYKELGLYTDARPLLEQSLGTFQSMGETNDLEAAVVMDNLGGLLRLSGNYDEAGTVLERALAVREQNLGRDHLEVAHSLNSLANLRWHTGDHAEAEALYLRSLAIREKKLGPDDPLVAITLNNIGGLRQEAGNFPGAREAFARALAIRQKVLGPEHPDTASSLAALGRLHQKLGEYDLARPDLERALAIREKVFGPRHPKVAESLRNLAGLLGDFGRHHEAQPLYQRALDIQTEALGADHPNRADTLNDLSICLRMQGDLEPALAVGEEGLAIYETAHGPSHPSVAIALNTVSLCMIALGDPQVFPYLERALEIQQQAAEPSPLDIAFTEYNLGQAHGVFGDYPAAQTHYLRSLEIREEHLAADHPLVGESLRGAGSVLTFNWETDRARPMLERALEICRQVHGTRHHEYAECLGLLGLLEYFSGQPAKARPLIERAVAIQEVQLDPGAPILLDNYYNLACINTVTGNPEAGLDYLERTVRRGFVNPYIMDDPDLASLHDNPRFREIVREMNGGSR